MALGSKCKAFHAAWANFGSYVEGAVPNTLAPIPRRSEDPGLHGGFQDSIAVGP